MNTSKLICGSSLLFSEAKSVHVTKVIWNITETHCFTSCSEKFGHCLWSLIEFKIHWLKLLFTEVCLLNFHSFWLSNIWVPHKLFVRCLEVQLKRVNLYYECSLLKALLRISFPVGYRIQYFSLVNGKH